MWKALQAKVAKALFGDASKAAPLPPPLELDYDLAAYRDFMCAETQFYREDYIRSRIKLKGQEHYEAALERARWWWCLCTTAAGCS